MVRTLAFVETNAMPPALPPMQFVTVTLFRITVPPATNMAPPSVVGLPLLRVRSLIVSGVGVTWPSTKK
jgi:hypothetical protein